MLHWVTTIVPGLWNVAPCLIWFVYLLACSGVSIWRCLQKSIPKLAACLLLTTFTFATSWMRLLETKRTHGTDLKDSSFNTDQKHWPNIMIPFTRHGIELFTKFQEFAGRRVFFVRFYEVQVLLF